MKRPTSHPARRLAAALAIAAAVATGVAAQTTVTPTPKPPQPPGSPPPPVPPTVPPGPGDVSPTTEKTVDPLDELRPPPGSPQNTVQDFASVDSELSAIERQVENAPSEDERDAAKVRLAALKDRRNELKANFNRARFELFKSDVASEARRLKEWKGANPSAAGGNNHPSVARLDIDLKLLRSRVEMLDGQQKAEVTRRVQDFERRRDALQQNFNQSEFDALQREIQSEWDRISRL